MIDLESDTSLFHRSADGADVIWPKAQWSLAGNSDNRSRAELRVSSDSARLIAQCSWTHRFRQ